MSCVTALQTLIESDKWLEIVSVSDDKLLHPSDDDIEDLQISPRKARGLVLAGSSTNEAGGVVCCRDRAYIGPASWLLSISPPTKAKPIATTKLMTIVPV